MFWFIVVGLFLCVLVLLLVLRVVVVALSDVFDYSLVDDDPDEVVRVVKARAGKGLDDRYRWRSWFT